MLELLRRLLGNVTATLGGVLHLLLKLRPLRCAFALNGVADRSPNRVLVSLAPLDSANEVRDRDEWDKPGFLKGRLLNLLRIARGEVADHVARGLGKRRGLFLKRPGASLLDGLDPGPD